MFQLDYGFTDITSDDPAEEEMSSVDEFLAKPNTANTEVEFILQVLSRLCDGQNRLLQVYLKTLRLL